MTPTPNFTEVWQAMERGYSSITTMRMVDAMTSLLTLALIGTVFICVLGMLVYLNRKRIKRWLK